MVLLGLQFKLIIVVTSKLAVQAGFPVRDQQRAAAMAAIQWLLYRLISVTVVWNDRRVIIRSVPG